MLIMLILCFVYSVIGSGLDNIGKINPSGELPLYMSITNQGELADYYFEFFPDHSVPMNSLLLIDFPEQYPQSLNSPFFSCSLGPCTISSRTITITLSSPLLASYPQILTLYSIQNPPTRGGTGNFALSTWQGSNLIDRNQIFGVLGIAETPGSLLSAVVSVISGGSTSAGDQAIYQFQFTLSATLQAWHWLRFTFPADYDIAAYPACSAFYIQSSFIPGALSCAATATQVLMTGISQDLIAGNEYGVYVTATNPHYSGVTGTFTIETGRNSTFTVLDRRQGIQGISISPGVIQDISLQPYNPIWAMTKNKMMLYRLEFLLKNPIDLGGYILLVFSNSFNMDYTSILEIEYGLDDISRTQTASMAYSITSKTLTISSFAAFSPVLISLLLQINNPSAAGVTNPIVIQSYLSDGTLVDEDTASAVATISIYSSPTATSVSYPGATGAQATGLATTIQINMFPQVQVPQLGYLTLSIPTGFDFTGVPTCMVQPTNMLLQASPSCTFLDGILTVQLYADTATNFGAFLSTVQSSVQIGNILAPESAGWYIFDFNSYSQVQDFLESGQATATMVGSIFSFSNFDVASGGISFPTVLFLNFDTGKVVPTGDVPYLTTELQGGIEILFPTMDSLGNLLFALQLGMGLAVGDAIPCKGITGIQSRLLCEVTYIPAAAAASENVAVTVWNFAEIPPGTRVTIHFAGISYVQTAISPVITVTTYQTYNRVRYDLETAQSNLVAGSLTPAVTALGISLLLSATEVNATSTLSTSAPISLASATVSATPYLLVLVSPTHEQGYCMYGSPICYVAGAAYPCYCYPGSDIVLVSLRTNILIAYTLTISGLVNPETVSSTGDGVVIYLIDNYSVKQYYTFPGPLPLLVAGVFRSPMIIVSDRGQGFVNTQYLFEIQPEHSMTDGGWIVVNFGAEYGLELSNPPSSCYTQYLPGEVTCLVSVNRITVSGYLENTQLFLLFVVGVKNPNVGISSPFSWLSYSKTGLVIDSLTNIPGVSFEGVWTTQDLENTIISINPTNANATAYYRISITPSNYLGVGGIIEILFPSQQFSTFPEVPNCRLVGDVTTFSTCQAYNTKILITLDTEPTPNIMYIDIIGLLNFPQGSSSSFQIRTIYDGVVLQQNFDPIIAVTTTQASTLQVASIDFYPQNEGETATYVFTIIPRFDIPVSSLIYIKFPIDYDQRLGDSFSCFSAELDGNLQCSSFTAYTITIYNHEYYFVCATCLIQLYIYGVVNPTHHSSNPYTGQFFIWISDGITYQELNEYSGMLELLPAGDYADIDLITHDGLYSRNIGLMGFNITTAMTIPATSDGGALWFSFPADYPLLSNNLHCTSSSFWALGVPDCNVYMNTVQANEQTEQFNGNLLVNILNLPYPWTEVLAGYIIVKVYDGVNSKLLSRTYPNLSPNRMSFIYPGPLIVVNNDRSFTVPAGTMSEFIPITLSYPCALNLTLVPSAPGFTLYPPLIPLQTGTVLQQFRISVSSNTQNGTYSIYWTTDGEIQPPYYVVIIPTVFHVTYTQSYIRIEHPAPIPVGGISLPVVVYFSNAPNSDLTVVFTLDPSLIGVSLSDYSLEFTDGEYSKNFTIAVDEYSLAKGGTIAVSTTGSNIDSFLLTSSLLNFAIIKEQGNPQVLAIQLTAISRTTANITVTANRICNCYYAYALDGSDPPSFIEIVLNGPAPYFTTRTNYGQVRVIENIQGFIYLEGLRKYTSYTLYMWLQDQSGHISLNSASFNFMTDTRYKAAQVTLYYDQTYLTVDDILLAKSTISLLLSLDDWRVIESPENSKTEPNTNVSPSSQGRRISTIQSYVTFIILDVDYSEVYPRPLDMIEILAGEEQKLKNILDNFDNTTEIKGVEIYMDECKFSIYPSVYSVFSRNATVQASLVEDGEVYAIISESPAQPYSFQVYLGLDSTNKPIANNNATVSSGDPTNINFVSLNQNTTYYVFFICTNNYPGYPDLLSDQNLVQLTFSTLPEPVLPSLKINNSPCMALSLVILLFFA